MGCLTTLDYQKPTLSAIYTPFSKQTTWLAPYITEHVCYHNLSKASLHCSLRLTLHTQSWKLLGSTTACFSLFLLFLFSHKVQDYLRNTGNKCCLRSYLLLLLLLPKAQILSPLLLPPPCKIMLFLHLMERSNYSLQSLSNSTFQCWGVEESICLAHLFSGFISAHNNITLLDSLILVQWQWQCRPL